jgi:hypothetical protein
MQASMKNTASWSIGQAPVLSGSHSPTHQAMTPSSENIIHAALMKENRTRDQAPMMSPTVARKCAIASA